MNADPIAGCSDQPLRAAEPDSADIDRYHQLLDAKFAGSITAQELKELDEVDRRLTEQSQIEADEFERRYPYTRAGRLEAGLQKIEELLSELRKSRQTG